MAGEPSFTQEQVDTMIAERLASETEGLKKNQAEVLKEAKAAKAKLASYEGVDPEKYKALVKAAEDAETKRLAGEGDWKAMEAQLVKKYEGVIESEKGVASRYRGSLEQHLIDAEAIRELAQHSDSPGLLLPHVKAQMKVLEQDGQFHARIVDAAGNVRIGKGQGSAPMTLGELMEEMKTDKTFAPAFRGSGSSGGGAAKSHAGGGSKTFNPATATGADFLASMKGLTDGTVTVAQ